MCFWQSTPAAAFDPQLGPGEAAMLSMSFSTIVLHVAQGLELSRTGSTCGPPKQRTPTVFLRSSVKVRESEFRGTAACAPFPGRS